MTAPSESQLLCRTRRRAGCERLLDGRLGRGVCHVMEL